MINLKSKLKMIKLPKHLKLPSHARSHLVRLFVILNLFQDPGSSRLRIKSAMTKPVKALGKIKFLRRVLFPLRNLSPKKRRALTGIALFILIIAIPISIYLLKHAGGASAAWFDEDFGYRQRVDITNSGSAQTDFQVAITLNTSTLITAGKMLSNCNDIRITDIAGKLLPFWVEKLASTACNTTTTKIWTKVPSISTTGNTLYVYYGNPQAANIENGKSVFVYFSDFSGSSLESMFTEADTPAEIAVSGGKLVFTGGASGGWDQSVYLTNAIARGDMAMEYDYQWTSNNAADDAFMFGWKDDGAGVSYANLVYGYYNRSADTCTTCAAAVYEDGSNIGGITGNWVQNTNYKARVRMRASGGAYYDQSTDGGITWTNSYTSTYSTESSLHPGWMLYAGTHSVDNFFVRKDAATVPTIAAPTNEEKAPAPVGYWKFDEGTGTTANDSSSNRNNGTLTNMASATGGTVTTSGAYTIHTFTSSGTFTDIAAMNVEVLVVGGGGSGGGSSGTSIGSGGGGAGGVVYNAAYSVTPQAYTVTVGGGGTGVSGFNAGNNGQNSVFGSLTAIGGGYGGTWTIAPTVGGSGGGAGENGQSLDGAAGTASQGNAGGNDSGYDSGAPSAGGGGGGAGAVGANTASTSLGGDGGAGLAYSISGSSVTYAGGGGGAGSTTAGSGGSGGGGGGKGTTTGTGTAGTANTGGGGGGSLTNVNEAAQPGGNGGSGIVIVRYLTPPNISSGWQSEDQCIAGKCLKFDGSNDYINTGAPSTTNFSGTTPFTISAWVKPTSISGTDVIVGKFNSNVAGQYRLALLNGKVTFHREISPHAVTGNTTLVVNKWYHVAGVYDGTNIRVYVNGLPDSAAQASGSVATDSNNVLIGAQYISGAPDEFFHGTIDEPKIYNYARSSAQIKVDYNLGAAAALGATDANKNLSNGLVGYWKMDEASWTGDCAIASVLDSSGNNNNGKACPNASAPSPAVGKFGNGGLFDGSNDYINVSDANSLDITSAITISTWVKLTDVTAYRQIIAKNATGFGYNDPYALRVDITTGKANARVGDGSANDNTVIGNTNVADGNWHQIVMTRDSSFLNVYVDGKQDATPVASTINMISNSTNLRIGSWEGASFYHKGSIDETRIYNRALPSREVQQLYNFAPGPIVYYKFEEKSGTSVSDSSGYGNNASFTGSPSWIQGKYGAGVNTGVTTSDYINAPNVDLPAGEWTAMTWFKYPLTSTGASWHTLFRGNGLDHQVIVQRSDMQLGVYDNTTLGYVGCGFIMSTLSSGWHHISVVGTGSVQNFYIDGVYKCRSAFKSTSDIKAIGNYQGGGQNWGQIDETKIYNYARTPGQIVEDINAGHPPPGSPVGSPLIHYKFDEGYGTTANSAVSTYSGTLYNNVSWTQNGKFGRALNFDGNTAQVVALGSGNLKYTGGDLSISAWIKPSASEADGGFIVSKPWNSGGDYNYWIKYESAGTINFLIGGATTYSLSTTETVSAGSWHYVTATIKGGTNAVNIYIDGRLSATGTNTVTNWTPPSDLNLNLVVGCIYPYASNSCAGSTQYDFNGIIDEVKIFNSALTTEQVKLDYNRGSSMVLGSLSDTSQLTGGSVASNSASAEYCVPGDTTSCASPVGRWDFEEGTGTQANDKSGNGNSATLTGGPAWTTGKIGKAISFDNTDDYLNCGTTGMPTAFPVTLEAWAYFNVDQADYDYVVQASSYTGSDDLVTMARELTTNKLYYVENGAVRNGPVLPTRVWTHITMVFTSTSVKAYINGVEQTIAQPSTTMTFPGAGCSIGRFTGPGNYMNGKIDQVRVFNYARTGAQIAWDYNKGAPVGHWKMDECQGSTINNSIGTTSGTLSIGASGSEASIGTCSTSSTAWGNGATGKLNYSVDLDGTDDYISTSNTSSLFDFTTGFTLSAWIKRASTQNSVDSAIISKLTNSPYDGYMLAYIPNTVSLIINGTSRATGVTTIPAATWTHVTATWDGTTARIYVNGKLDGSGAYSTAPGGIGQPFSIGRYSTTLQRYFTGSIDDVRAYNYGLTASQVRVLYNNGAINFGPNTGAP